MSAKKNSIGLNKDPKDTTVVVAMSGGVDSSTVAGIMKEEGYNVIGITLKLYDDTKEVSKSKQCCAGQDILDAKRVADSLGIEHKILYYLFDMHQVYISLSLKSNRHLEQNIYLDCQVYRQHLNLVFWQYFLFHFLTFHPVETSNNSIVLL